MDGGDDGPVGEQVEVMGGDPVDGEVGLLVVSALGVVGCVWWAMSANVVCWHGQEGRWSGVGVGCDVGLWSEAGAGCDVGLWSEVGVG